MMSANLNFKWDSDSHNTNLGWDSCFYCDKLVAYVSYDKSQEAYYIGPMVSEIVMDGWKIDKGIMFEDGEKAKEEVEKEVMRIFRER